MSATLTAILGGSAILGGLASNRAANQAGELSAELQKYQNLISAEKVAFDSAAQQYNMTKQFGELLSGANAMAAGMGKSTTGGSMMAAEAEGRSTLQRDIDLLDKKTEFSRRTADIANQAIDYSTKKKEQSRNLGLLSRGIATASILL